MIGAGPAGCLTAMMLSKKGYENVLVFERRERPRPRGGSLPAHHTYPMVLNSRSLSALAAVGADLACAGTKATPMSGMCSLDTGRLVAGRGRGDSFVVDRASLAADVLDEAERLYPGIKFSFESRLEGVDTAARTVTVCTADGQQTTVPYDLLVGADGANSAVRAALAASVAPTVPLKSQKQYKTFRGLRPPRVAAVPDLASHLPHEYVYFIRSKSGQGSVAAWRVADGSFSGMLSGPVSWEPEALRRQLEQDFALPAEWVEDVVAQTGDGSGQAPSSFGQIVRCAALHGGREVLVGDAAHAVTSTLGQVRATTTEGANLCSSSSTL